MKHQQKTWRVRVMRRLEDWIDVKAETAEQAEKEAATRPGIVGVFTGSTVSGEKPLGLSFNPSIEDDEE